MVRHLRRPELEAHDRPVQVLVASGRDRHPSLQGSCIHSRLAQVDLAGQQGLGTRTQPLMDPTAPSHQSPVLVVVEEEPTQRGLQATEAAEVDQVTQEGQEA